MNAGTLCSWLRVSNQTPAEKLAALRASFVEEIRNLSDPDYATVLQAMQRLFAAPALAIEFAELMDDIARDYNEPAYQPIATTHTYDGAGDLIAAIGAAPDAVERYEAMSTWLKRRNLSFDARVHHEGMLATYPEISEVDWIGDFVRGCRIAFRDRPIAIDQILAELLDGPGRFLQHLTIGSIGWGNRAYDRIIKVLAREERVTLHTLSLGDGDQTAVNNLATLWPAVPNLRELTVRTGHMPMRDITLPKLERLQTITSGLDPTSLAEIARTSWPSLTHLLLQTGNEPGGGTVDATVLGPLLTSRRTPRLTALGLSNCTFTNDACRLLTDSALLPRLTALDLSEGTMTDTGARHLVIYRDRFLHLNSIDVNGNHLSPVGCKLLEATFPSVSIGQQRAR